MQFSLNQDQSPRYILFYDNANAVAAHPWKHVLVVLFDEIPLCADLQVTAILVLDTVGNVVRAVFYSLNSGPLIFVTGQVEPTSKLGIVSAEFLYAKTVGSV